MNCKKTSWRIFYQKNHRWINALLIAVLPIVVCLLNCAANGKGLFDVWIGASEWNDELFYYKQVEGMVHFGVPQGYYGFNESSGQYLTFAAWSPVLLIPWTLWGLVFGWNEMSPILCNIFWLTLAMFLFTFLAKLQRKQMILVSAMFILFTPFSRYMLSTMPEIIVISILIIVFGLVTSCNEEFRYWKICTMFALLAVLTLMRPYLVMFMIFPAILLISKKKLGILVSILIMGLSLGLYVLINKCFGAPYFSDLFRTEWIRTFLDKGLFEGVKYSLGTLYYYGIDFVHILWQGILTGLAPGAYFTSFMLLMGIFFIQAIVDIKHHDKKNMKISIPLFICQFGMLMALLLMYKLNEGSKHLVTFIAAEIFLVAIMPNKRGIKVALISIAFAWLFILKCTSKMDYAVPFINDEKVEMDELRNTLETSMSSSHQIGWENTVIWVFHDKLPLIDSSGFVILDEAGNIVYNEEKEMVAWQHLYAVPNGFGINLCQYEYVLDNIDHLRSRYVATIPNGSIEALLVESGAVFVGGDSKISIYDLGGR